MTGLEVHTARADTGTKCCRCRAAIRQGEEFAIERWPNGGGFDHLHVECPKLDASTHGPLLVQGHDRPRRKP